MSDSAAPNSDQPTDGTGAKPWWKRWWGITLIVLAVLLVIGSIGGDPEEPAEEVAAPAETSTPTEAPPAETATPTTAPATECEDADSALVSAIEEGLTVDGGGSLENAKAIELPDDLRNDREWPVYVVGAEITGPGLDGVVGTWATDAEGGPIFALNQMAREFSDWGSAAQPGSDAAAVRDTIASYEETSQVEECASR